MSTFGDNTPHQEMLDDTKRVQYDFDLTDDEVVVVLLQVLKHYVDPFDDRSEDILRKKQEI